MKLKVEKCEFFQEEVTFLGHRLTRKGIKACHDKVEKITSFPTPKNKDEIRSFLGLASYYRKFVEDFAKMAKPLNENLRENKQFEWGPKQEKAFSDLKNALANTPTLAYPQENEPYIITVGYTPVTISAILSQKVERREMPLNFASRSLQGAELEYFAKHGPDEVELLAINYALKQFYSEIFNNPVVIRGQSKVIETLTKTTTAANQRMGKWLNMLKNFPDLKYEVVNDNKIKPAKELAEAEKRFNESKLVYLDLSACFNTSIGQPPDLDYQYGPVMDKTGEFHNPVMEFEESIYLSPSLNADEYIPILFTEFWRDLQAKDPFSQAMIKRIRQGKTDMYRVDEEGLLRRTVNNENRMVIPYLGRDHLMYLFHAPPRRGHYDGRRTFEAARPFAYWPNMQRDVLYFCQRCSRCQFYNKRTGKPSPYPRTLPEKPWQMCSADLKGPLPASAKGHKYILVMQDLLTRTLKLALMKGPTADEAAMYFIDRVIREEGTPEVILTDQGTHFTARLYNLICAHLGVNHITTTAYHPQSNGANERSHKELARFLSIYSTMKRPEDWHLLVKEAEWVHNTTYHASLKRSPYEATRGFAPPLHGLGRQLKAKNKIMEEAIEGSEPDASDHEVLQKYFVLLDEEIAKTRDEVYEHLNRVQEQYRKAMLLEQNKYLDLKPGDLVLLAIPGTAIKGSVKKYDGPFRILKRYSLAVYKIEDIRTGKWQVVNQIRLKRYYPPNKIDDANLRPPSETRQQVEAKKTGQKPDPLNPAIVEDDEMPRRHPMVLRPRPTVSAPTPASPLRDKIAQGVGRAMKSVRDIWNRRKQK